MSSQDEVLKDYEAYVNEDQRKRQSRIAEGEALDKEIQLRMDAGEIGVSHGTDNHIGVIMLSIATVFTLFCLYVIFYMSPAHYGA
ncbi:MAG: hypothetical protein MK515_05015 [SAR324 cluster bacterium]|jgi:formylmethanofuran dehydrogenase subunit C|nr:hypothetical protein [SAR324 cluster bacterium]MCH2265813.1 hypothetical protein [SAR324 cluster bacterium]|tara:strand:- start:227 stop:481 length:255 start_codon:yes stop_codon:yes gene_type:complete